MKTLTVEELLKTAETGESVTIETNDLVNFLNYYALAPGEKEYPRDALYELYSRWSKEPMPRVTFIRQMRLMTNCTPTGYFKLNKTPVETAIKTPTKKRSYSKFKSQLLNRHYQEFTNHYKIESGRFALKAVFLYDLYLQWRTVNNRTTRIKPQTFNQISAAFFKKKIVKGVTYFLVSKSILNHLSQDVIDAMKEHKDVEVSPVKNQVSSPKQTTES